MEDAVSVFITDFKINKYVKIKEVFQVEEGYRGRNLQKPKELSIAPRNWSGG